MTTENTQSDMAKMFGDFAPKLVSLTDDVLFGDVWEREGLSPRDRSLATITGLIAAGNIDQLNWHIPYGIQNGLTETEIKEAIIHLAFYAGWPKAVSAMAVAKRIFDNQP
ncbi:4-carboxymuconolactone decarboxylase [Arthrobacter sp. ok909]|uniref:carboxymuconolactone decarboxylase family protein n=1 Tax=Arthrobacter sp. ok909 TaxID=1761746 RepID=UPI000880BAF7|nr:carboxymuconolactone decarboxylase family protein [Arthrobacter sp. ok909]SDP63423.1 4-carboxymuconolactone decarboxylase [Arthrobacter sp. ok909]